MHVVSSIPRIEQKADGGRETGPIGTDAQPHGKFPKNNGFPLVLLNRMGTHPDCPLKSDCHQSTVGPFRHPR